MNQLMKAGIDAASGSVLGNLWAANDAQLCELRRLKRAAIDFDEWAEVSDAEDWAEKVCAIIHADTAGSSTCSVEFWEKATASDEHPSNDFVRAFVESALEMFGAKD